jgi:hypothetical protein
VIRESRSQACCFCNERGNCLRKKNLTEGSVSHLKQQQQQRQLAEHQYERFSLESVEVLLSFIANYKQKKKTCCVNTNNWKGHKVGNIKQLSLDQSRVCCTRALFRSQILPQIPLCKKEIPHHIKMLVNAWSTKCR